MRKFFLLLAVALLISIPAFAINNHPVAVSPAPVAATPIENTQIFDRVPVTNVAYTKEANEQATEAGYVEEISSVEIMESTEPTPATPEKVSAPSAQPVVVVVATTSTIIAAVSTQVDVPAKAQVTVVIPELLEVAVVPVAQETTSVPVVAPAPAVAVAPAQVAVAADRPLIDTSEAQQGIVTINYSGTAKARLEVRKGDVKYYYNLYARQDNFPLQLGSGQYTITVFENTTDNKYRAVERSIIDVSITAANSVFLASIQEIKWSESSLTVAKARQLTAGLGTNRAKFEALYRFVVDNIDYDTPKLATLTSTYLPNIDTTLNTGKGICYDHASLLAAMLRSQGIPTKMVKGYASTVQGYHAWNEVYIDGQWLIIDASVDAQRRARGAELTMVKTSAVYSKTLEF